MVAEDKQCQAVETPLKPPPFDLSEASPPCDRGLGQSPACRVRRWSL